MAQNIDMNGAWTQDDSITRAELEAGVENATVFDIARDNLSAVQRLIYARTSAPSSPKDGEMWANLNAAAGGPQRHLSHWNDAAGIWVDLANAVYSAGAPSSAYERNGQLWYDETRALWRVYRDATYDGGSTYPTAIIGWHPVSDAFQLMKNENASTISIGSVVVRGAAAWGINVGTKEKDPTVAGVAMEDILTGTFGVVCTVEGGGRCKMLVDAGTYTIGIGDGLVHSTTSASARSVGALPSGTHLSSSAFSMGTPYGCFARAEEVKTSGTGVIKIKMLGSVGSGARVWQQPASIRNYVSTTPPTSYTATDFSLLASGTVGAQGASTSLSGAKHGPIIAAEVEIAFSQTANAGGDAQLDIFLSKDGTNSAHKYTEVVQDVGTPNPIFAGRVNLGMVATSTGATPWTGVGSSAYFVTAVTAGGTWVGFQITMPGYIY